MRQLRILKQDVWYCIRTAINNREPLFRLRQALALFGRVLEESKGRFVFEIAGLRLEDEWLVFYIRPTDGLELPDIIKWLKQTFAVRYNLLMGRIGHIWGDRYWSLILEGEPSEGGMEGGEETEDEPPVTARIMRVEGRPQYGGITYITEFSYLFSRPLVSPPP
jgi:hypothetical protein